MGRTAAPDGLRSAEDVLDTLLDFAEEVTDGTPYLLIGHSAGAYYAQAMAARAPGAGRWSRAGLPAAAGRARRPGAPRRRRVG